MRVHSLVLLILLLTAAVASPAAAYVGPGAGLGVLWAFWALVIAVCSALMFVLLWPLRRMFKRSKSRTTTNKASKASKS